MIKLDELHKILFGLGTDKAKSDFDYLGELIAEIKHSGLTESRLLRSQNLLEKHGLRFDPIRAAPENALE